MIIIISRWSYNCEGEHLCSQFLKDWWRENGGWLKFWASNIVYFWNGIYEIIHNFAGVEKWNPSNVKIKNVQKQTRKWIWSCSYWWIVFCSFLNNFKRPSWLAAFSVLKSETQSMSRSRMGKNRRDCRNRKNGFGLPHIFESYFCFSF